MSDRKSGRAKALRSDVFKEAEQNLRLLEKETIRVTNREWELADAISDLLNAYGEPRITAALSRLATLNASYRGEADVPAAPTMWSRILHFLGARQALRPALSR